MRLLNSTTLKLKEFFDSQIPVYVILSHTWCEEEITFQDIQDINQASKMKGFAKVKKCCDQASKDGFKWVWIDTCCIDKSSSSELSEAINSMFRWYQESKICYAYLEDVVCKCHYPDGQICKEFTRSRWFTRGWTLQELVAPPTVEFYSNDWSEIGTKQSLRSAISDVTGINTGILRGDSLSSRSIAERMSWAADRETTRMEDLAYSLMGLFGVSMPMLYGEGGKKAFIRLQEEIMKLSEDYTLFAWTDQSFLSNTGCGSNRGLLAQSPKEFRYHFETQVYADLHVNPPIEHDYLGIGLDNLNLVLNNPNESTPSLTSRGLRISLAVRIEGDTHLAYLNCCRRQDRHMLCISLAPLGPEKPYHYVRTNSERLIFLPPEQAQDFRHVPMYVKDPDRSELGAMLGTMYHTCDFLVEVEPNNHSVIKISKGYPYDQWNYDAKRMRTPGTPSSAGVIEFWLGTKSRFMVLFGIRENSEEEPWCDIPGDKELTDFFSVEQVFRAFQSSDHLDASDRIKRVLGSGNQVSVSVRKGLAHHDFVNNRRLHRYTLKVSIL